MCPILDICCVTDVRSNRPVRRNSPLSENRQKGSQMSDRLDRRSRRSRSALWEALLHLMHEQDWATISVQMICDRADVARSTFYAHFPTKQDLLDTGFAEGTAQLETMAAGTGLAGTLDWLANHLRGAAAFHRRLQGSAAGQAIMLRFRRLIRDQIARDQGCVGNGHETGLDFAVGGVFAVLEAWLGSGCREDTSTVVEGLVFRVLQVTTWPQPAV